MKGRHFLGLVLLAAWVLLGPVAMAFDGCAAMMAACDLPCAAAACLVSAPEPLATPETVAAVAPRAESTAVSITLGTPKLPPKSPLPTA
jgi:hypothetical protein